MVIIKQRNDYIAWQMKQGNDEATFAAFPGLDNQINFHLTTSPSLTLAGMEAVRQWIPVVRNEAFSFFHRGQLGRAHHCAFCGRYSYERPNASPCHN